MSSYQVKYKQSTAKATSVGVTPEVERVKQNQENISSARKHQDILIIFLLHAKRFQYSFKDGSVQFDR